MSKKSVGIVGLVGRSKIAHNVQGLALLGDLKNVRPVLLPKRITAIATGGMPHPLPGGYR